MACHNKFVTVVSYPYSCYTYSLTAVDSTFLLVFDNADDTAALKTAWPTAIHGLALWTTRGFIVATSLTTKYVLVDALSDEDGSRLLLKEGSGPRRQFSSEAEGE